MMEDPTMPPGHQLVPPQTVDPITAILVAVTEMRALLGSAVDDLKEHGGEIRRLREQGEDRGNRITRLESFVATLPTSTVSPAAVWTALAVAFAAIAALAAVLGLHLGS